MNSSFGEDVHPCVAPAEIGRGRGYYVVARRGVCELGGGEGVADIWCNDIIGWLLSKWPSGEKLDNFRHRGLEEAAMPGVVEPVRWKALAQREEERCSAR